MGQKLSSSELALYCAVGNILHLKWDPLGVAGLSEARDEYQAYLPQVFAMVKNKDEVASIAAYLSHIRIDRMGLSEDEEHDLQISELLLERRDAVYGSST